MLIHMHRNRQQRQNGFTLVEVLIAVAIVGILAGVGLPSYISHTQKVRRADAKVTLVNSAQQLERCNIEFSAYNDSGCASDLASGTAITTPEGYYTITPTVLTATTFTLTASPVSGKGQDSDTDCTTFTINQAGGQTATGGNSSICW